MSQEPIVGYAAIAVFLVTLAFTGVMIVRAMLANRARRRHQRRW